MTTHIGLYGGSFDPIHFGHLISARSAAEQLGLSRIVLIPSAVPPHKQEHVLTPAEDRLSMARLAVADDPMFEVSDIELRRAGPSYTFDTVTQFRKQLGPAVNLCWIIGADSLSRLPTWYRIAELVKLVRIVTLTRPGWTHEQARVVLNAGLGPAATDVLLQDCLNTPAIQISATQIRTRLGDGKSIRYLVPESVRSYIKDKHLYASV
jgi:nicotinate-nucleotide adenylyltransferase